MIDIPDVSVFVWKKGYLTIFPKWMARNSSKTIIFRHTQVILWLVASFSLVFNSGQPSPINISFHSCTEPDHVYRYIHMHRSVYVSRISIVYIYILILHKKSIISIVLYYAPWKDRNIHHLGRVSLFNSYKHMRLTTSIYIIHTYMYEYNHTCIYIYT